MRPHKVICISIYTDDLQMLDRKVEALKSRYPRANRSELIRYALSLVDPDTVPLERLVARPVTQKPAGSQPRKPRKGEKT